MKTRHDTLSVLARGGMELSWRYAWSLFLTLLMTGRPFPIPSALCAFTTAAVLTHLTHIKRLRMVQLIALQSIGFVVCVLLTVYPGHSQGFSFFNPDWISGLLLDSKTLGQWFALVLLILCQLLIWRGGQILVKGPENYDAVCIQFDKGLGLLFFLLIVKSLFQLRGGLDLPIPVIGFTALAFLIFSLVSIGLARNEGYAEKSFLAGFHVLGLIVSIAAIVVIFGAGVTFLTFPYLYHLADLLLNSIDQASGPVIPVLIKILLFFLKPRNFIESPEPSGTDVPRVDYLDPGSAAGEESIAAVVVITGLTVFFGLAITCVVGLILIRLIRWLLKRPSPHDAGTVPENRFAMWLKRLASIPLWIWNFLLSNLKGISSAAMAFAAMRRWGRRSGLKLTPGETPAEYGERLGHHFPRLQVEISLIVETFNREIYGQVRTGDRALVQVKAAHRSMLHVRHWPGRVKIWLRI